MIATPDCDRKADAALRRRAPEPIPITLLTGFLGAGKTTLLNRLVASPALAGAVVIINEIGEIPIDHLLVEKAEGGLLTLSSGCLCCTVRGDMVSTLEDLLRRRDNGRMPAFDRVVIETTGLADPAPILNTIVVHPYLVLRFRIDGVITLVDAVHGTTTLDTYREAVQQVAIADSLVLTKTDLAADHPQDLDGLRRRLAALNPAADLVDVGAATAEGLLAANLFRNADRLASDAEPHASAGHDHHGHDHAHGPHDDHVGSFVLTAAGPLQPASFAAFVDLLRSTCGPALLRVKGLVGLADDPERPLVIQGVQHLFHPPRRLPCWPDADRRSRLVVIGRDLDRGKVERLWAAFFGPPAIDAADGAALFPAVATGLF